MRMLIVEYAAKPYDKTAMRRIVKRRGGQNRGVVTRLRSMRRVKSMGSEMGFVKHSNCNFNG